MRNLENISNIALGTVRQEAFTDAILVLMRYGTSSLVASKIGETL